MKISGEYELSDIYARHFDELAKEVDINAALLKQIIKNQCEKIPNILESVISEFDNTIGEKILFVAKHNCNLTLERLSIE